jgi:hypothetical protein
MSSNAHLATRIQRRVEEMAEVEMECDRGRVSVLETNDLVGATVVKVADRQYFDGALGKTVDVISDIHLRLSDGRTIRIIPLEIDAEKLILYPIDEED